MNPIPAIMLMTPDDKVEEVWDERFGNVVGWTTLGSVLNRKTKDTITKNNFQN